MLRQPLETIRERIVRACQRAGRSASAVTLIGVTKGVGVELITEAVSLGLTELGENRVQEARAKQQALRAATPPVRWHLIGHLQRNKARHAVELFQVIHSVDSVALAEELERQMGKRITTGGEAGAAPPALDVLIQVNVSGEATKFGCRPEELIPLARAVSSLPRLRWAGLMTIAPVSDDAEASRPHFRRLRGLRDEAARALGYPASELQLSMGMSQDFEVAIEEGADCVRVGTAIFGERPT